MELKLIPEEQELADALLRIATKYGKFNADNTGIWAGYTPASENEENSKIGVKCGSCVFFRGGGVCEIIVAEVEDGGLCRLAILPDGAVNASGGSSAPAEVLDTSKIKKGSGAVTLEISTITADVDGYGGECPPATQDIQLNLTNRQNAIDNVGYGPLNPAEPNNEFWQDKATRWKTDIQEAKSAVCGNCIFFVRTPKMLDCIEEGIGLGSQEAEGSIEAGELGYCNALDFKCASERTCNAWAAGGPVTEETVTATAGSKPAPKKDQIKGSTKNPKGSAKDGKSVNFTATITKSLEKKVKEHNEKAPNGRKVTLAKLKAVYRRGAGAFSTSHRPDQNRNSWAMARVNAFLHLVKSGRPKNAKYISDNDLLPKMHPKSTTASAILLPLIASLNFEEPIENEGDLDGPWLFD
jgi:hypothetical protein